MVVSTKGFKDKAISYFADEDEAGPSGGGDALSMV